MAANRRPDERRGGDRDHEDYRRNETPRAEAPATRNRAQLNEYFVEGDGIHREVLQMEICRYLGAEATCRPGEYNGRQGYRVKALRPFTPEMIHDLKTASRDYISENRDRRTQRYQEVPYEESDTRRLNNTSISSAELSYQSPSATSATAPGYPGPENGPGIGYPSTSAYPAGSGYVQASTFTATPNMSAAPSAFQPMTTDTRGGYSNNYIYGPPREYTPSQPDYAGYPLAASYREQAREQQPPGYTYPSQNGPPMPLGRGVAMDPSRYYESNMGMAPPSTGAYGPPFRNRSPPYGEPGPSRAHDSRQGPQPDSYAGYRRR